MSNDSMLREEIRHSLGPVRTLISGYSGLYSGEDLTRDVLRTCDEMTVERNARLDEARRMIEDRCRRLAYATSRYVERDPVTIAASRAQAVAAVDLLQDAIFEWRKARTPAPQLRGMLRRKSL